MFGKKKKRSFIDKLTGSVHIPDYDDEYYDDVDDEDDDGRNEVSSRPLHQERHRTDNEHTIQYPTIKPLYSEDEIAEEEDHDPAVGELSVDVFETPDEIVVKAMVAGVKPADLDIDISRDSVTIFGTREFEKEVEDDSYFHQELYWGSFKRVIGLPEEIDVDQSEATEKNGLLILKLPKLDKGRKAKLRVKSEK